ncbi:hypothetical protein UFOVP119_59 [uncultured Caudovirales phage]|uniref:DUF7694 domain-containing protein n=1 Tax=uncultured Caudovirales phage TaxID=2100421 RepID=A0A6J5L8U7_9CAUD|nr:hypothetical protein UFOVP119_59 [uncultured Caudovirales phage]
MKPMNRAKAIPPTWTRFYADAAKMGVSLDEAKTAYQRAIDQECWRNDLYVVLVDRYADGSAHLSIRRDDRGAARDWRHFQQIKNDILGPEVEAVELYPAESRVVDEANQFHLWSIPLGQRIGIGYRDGLRDYRGGDTFKQRPEGEEL